MTALLDGLTNDLIFWPASSQSELPRCRGRIAATDGLTPRALEA